MQCDKSLFKKTNRIPRVTEVLSSGFYKLDRFFLSHVEATFE